MGTANQSFFHVTTVEGNPVRIKTPPSVVVRGASTANIADLTATSTSMDGLTLVAGDLVLLKNQTTASQNGIYAVGDVSGSAAALTRVWPMESGVEIPNGTRFFVQAGTVNGAKWWHLTNAGTITVGTTGLTFAQVVDSGSLTNSVAQVNVPLALGILAAGTPLAAFADNASSNPGITLADSKAVAVRWNNNASQTAVWYTVPMPQDVDDTADLVMHILASKTGATVGDATTFTVTAFFQTVGALHDADANCGGTSTALTGNATAKTVAELTLTIAAADVPPSPATLSFTIKPTDGLLGTDDALVEGIWFEYTRKIGAS